MEGKDGMGRVVAYSKNWKQVFPNTNIQNCKPYKFLKKKVGPAFMALWLFQTVHQ